MLTGQIKRYCFVRCIDVTTRFQTSSHVMRLAVTMSVPGCMLSAKYVEAVLSFSVSVLCSSRFDVSAQNTRICVHVALDVYIYKW